VTFTIVNETQGQRLNLMYTAITCRIATELAASQEELCSRELFGWFGLVWFGLVWFGWLGGSLCGLAEILGSSLITVYKCLITRWFKYDRD
jgi:hypothetical protein